VPTTIKTVDAHVGGQPLRLVVDGVATPRGRTMADKRDWLARNADRLRALLMHEPRGHADMCGALLTEPVSPGSHAGIVFMDNTGYGNLSIPGVIGATAIAIARGLLTTAGDTGSIVFDTPAGAIRAELSPGHTTTGGQTVNVTGVPSFVLAGGLVVAIGTKMPRHVRADVAFGGEFYAIVDGESVGLPLDALHVPELRRVGMEIARAIDSTQVIAHPVNSRIEGIGATIFTGPSNDTASDLRIVTVFANGQVDRSACGTGMAAVMAVLNAMGLIADDAPFVAESVIGTRLSARLSGRTSVGEFEAIVPQIEGTAWITGDHAFIIDDDDPLAGGFVIASA
jgi:proline racemase